MGSFCSLAFRIVVQTQFRTFLLLSGHMLLILLLVQLIIHVIMSGRLVGILKLLSLYVGSHLRLHLLLKQFL